MGAIVRRAASLRRRRRATVALCVAVLMVAGSLGFAQDWGGRSIPPSNDKSPSPSSDDERRSYPIDDAYVRLALGDGSVWAAGFDVTRLDETTGEVEAEIALPKHTHANAIVFGDGLLWALVEANDGRLDSRYVTVIDPERNEVVATSPRLFRTNIGTDQDGVLAVGEGSAWVAFRGELYEISPEGTFTRTDIPAGKFHKNDRNWGAYTIAYGGDSLWLARGDGPLRRFYPNDLHASIGHNLGPNINYTEAGSENLWISHFFHEHRLGRRSYSDPADLHWLNLPLSDYGPYWQPVLGGDSMWVVRPAGGRNVLELDEPTGRVIQRFRLPIDYSYGAAASDDALWIARRDGERAEIVRVPSGR